LDSFLVAIVIHHFTSELGFKLLFNASEKGKFSRSQSYIMFGLFELVLCSVLLFVVNEIDMRFYGRNSLFEGYWVYIWSVVLILLGFGRAYYLRERLICHEIEHS